MWLSLFLAYCLFCTNWLIFSKLKGSSSADTDEHNSKGWKTVFGAISNGVAAESVNFSVTAASGIFTMPASYILLKLGYSKACLLACGLATMALPLIFSPHWSILILGRKIMAAGGTLTIIYISPLLSKLTLPEKKKKLAALNGFTFALSGLVVNILFMITPLANFLVDNWSWAATVFALFSFMPLILFYMYGQNFEMVSLSEKLKVESPDNYSTLLSEKEAWIWIISYSFLLVVSILFSSFVPQKLTKLIPHLEKNFLQSINWTSLYTVIFFLGTCAGLYFLGKLNTKNIQSVSMVSFSIATILFLWGLMAVTSLMAKTTENATFSIMASILIFFSIFWFAFFGLGIQSVLLYIPLEYKNYSPQKSSIFFSCLWGIGYMILTCYYILASVMDHLAGTAWSLVFITFLITLFYYFSTKLSESSPDYTPLLHWLKEMKNSEKTQMAISEL